MARRGSPLTTLQRSTSVQCCLSWLLKHAALDVLNKPQWVLHHMSPRQFFLHHRTQSVWQLASSNASSQPMSDLEKINLLYAVVCDVFVLPPDSYYIIEVCLLRPHEYKCRQNVDEICNDKLVYSTVMTKRSNGGDANRPVLMYPGILHVLFIVYTGGEVMWFRVCIPSASK